MQPEGLWQRLAAAPTDSAPIFPPLLHTTIQIPSPTTCALYRGYPIYFPPWPPDKGKEETARAPRKEKKRKGRTPALLLPRLHSLPLLGQPSLLLRPDLRAALLRPLLSGRGLTYGSLRGRGPSLPAWGGW